MKKLIFPLASLFVLSMTSCASKWSEQQKASIRSIGAGDVNIRSNAFHKPDHSKSPNATSSVTTATGGGLIPALLGSLIDAGVTSAQNSAFKSQYGDVIPKLTDLSKSAPTSELRSALNATIKKDAFLGKRYSTSPSTKVDAYITSYGLVRGSKSKDKYKTLAYAITADLKIVSSEGKDLINLPFVTGVSKLEQTPRSISSTSLAQFKQEAAMDLAKKLQVQIDAKLGRE